MGLLISAYVEGSSSERAIELFNPTCADISLAEYHISMITNGGSWGESSLALSGTVAGGASYVICHDSLDSSVFSGCDVSSPLLESLLSLLLQP